MESFYRILKIINRLFGFSKSSSNISNTQIIRGNGNKVINNQNVDSSQTTIYNHFKEGAQMNYNWVVMSENNIKPISFFRHHFTQTSYLFSGIFLCALSLTNLFGNYGEAATLLLFTMCLLPGIVMITGWLGIMLSSNNCFFIQNKKYYAKDGKLFTSVLKGKCPICGGNLNLYYINNNFHVVKCADYPNSHLAEFCPSKKIRVINNNIGI